MASETKLLRAIPDLAVERGGRHRHGTGEHAHRGGGQPSAATVLIPARLADKRVRGLQAAMRPQSAARVKQLRDFDFTFQPPAQARADRRNSGQRSPCSPEYVRAVTVANEIHFTRIRVRG